jgi:hypothetical protein
MNGKRSFYPIAYGFGEGEREIVALHTILNVKYDTERFFGISHIEFKVGIVSGRSKDVAISPWSLEHMMTAQFAIQIKWPVRDLTETGRSCLSS